MYQQLELVRSVTTVGASRPERFDKQIGNSHWQMREIVVPLAGMSLETLFLLENGAVPAVRRRADLLNTAAVQTLRHGGDVQTPQQTSSVFRGARLRDLSATSEVPNSETRWQDNFPLSPGVSVDRNSRWITVGALPDRQS